MSEHNPKLRITKTSEKKNVLSEVHVSDDKDNLYIVNLDGKTKSIISIGGGKFDHKEVSKFVDDFIKEISTETTQNA